MRQKSRTTDLSSEEIVKGIRRAMVRVTPDRLNAALLSQFGAVAVCSGRP